MIALYNPRTKTFGAVTAPDAVDLPFSELLLLNILIELQVLTQVLATADTPEDLRTDLVSN